MSITLVDPRIPPTDRVPALAPRPASLVGRRVLLFDNGKLGAAYGPYRAIFDVVAEELRRRWPDVEIVEHSDDLLRGEGTRLPGVAQWIADQQIACALFALCDWGVSQPTAIVAAAAEQLGVATSVVATDIGSRQVLANAARMCPGLPVAVLRSLRSAPYDLVAAEIRELTDTIVTGLVGGADLVARFAEHSVHAPAPAEASGVVELDADDTSRAWTELMAESRLGDGLPLVGPTVSLVEEFLAAAACDPDETIWPVIPPRSSPVTARQVAAVAVSAGARPEWAPVVMTAYRAMGADEFRLFQAAITTHPGGMLVFVSGPDSARYGLADGRGALGPGFAANATIGRAVALGTSFLLGAIPGGSALTSQGSPAQYSYCTAENRGESPWPGLHADLADPDATTVTVLVCEGPHNMLDQQSSDPASLLRTFASTMATLGSNAAYVHGAQTMLLLNPEHAALLAGAGWSKRDVQSFLFDEARNRHEDLRGRGIAPIWPRWFDDAPRVPVLPSAEDLFVVVAGGAGPASQVAIPWGYSRAVTRTITPP